MHQYRRPESARSTYRDQGDYATEATSCSNSDRRGGRVGTVVFDEELLSTLVCHEIEGGTERLSD